jgi:Pyruvate/2-oxoacid:ferredoxin oxidoreductase delta subunit
MKPSTKALFRLHGWRNIPGFIHGYIYGRWPNGYLAFITGSVFKRKGRSKPGKPSLRPVRAPGPVDRWFAGRYHSKVLTSEDASKIIKLDRPVVLENPERVVPFEMANRIVLDAPGTLAVMRCPCRQAKGEEACGPLEVCMVIGSPFVEFVVEHGTNGARAITREEAVRILEESRDRGWVHTAWFKDAMGGRFYAVCNCCRCCCLGLKGMKRSGYEARYVTASGYIAALNGPACAACGKCETVCAFEAVTLRDGLAVVNRERCFGCGVCAALCPAGALTMVSAPEKGVPFDVEALM